MCRLLYPYLRRVLLLALVCVCERARARLMYSALGNEGGRERASSDILADNNNNNEDETD